MMSDDTMTVVNIARRHEGTAEEPLLNAAASAMKTIDKICAACQNNDNTHEEGGARA